MRRWRTLCARFDRLADGTKQRQEDFCQLALQPAKQKYDGSAELCARLVKRYATEPVIEALRLFRLVLAAWWTGNGDMHLKNFSIVTDASGISRLSPAYDLVCTRLVIEDDDLALPVGGKKSKLTRRDWVAFGRYCGLRPRVIERVFGDVTAALPHAAALVDGAPLSDSAKADLPRAAGRTRRQPREALKLTGRPRTLRRLRGCAGCGW